MRYVSIYTFIRMHHIKKSILFDGDQSDFNYDYIFKCIKFKNGVLERDIESLLDRKYGYFQPVK